MIRVVVNDAPAKPGKEAEPQVTTMFCRLARLSGANVLVGPIMRVHKRASCRLCSNLQGYASGLGGGLSTNVNPSRSF